MGRVLIFENLEGFEKIGFIGDFQIAMLLSKTKGHGTLSSSIESKKVQRRMSSLPRLQPDACEIGSVHEKIGTGLWVQTLWMRSEPVSGARLIDSR